MTMLETSRFIRGLRAMGWSAGQINDFILYIADGYEGNQKINENADEEEREGL